MKNIHTEFDHYCTVLETLPVPAYLVSADGELLIRYANAPFLSLLSISRDELQYKYGGRLDALTLDIPVIPEKNAATVLPYLDQTFQLPNHSPVYLRTRTACILLDDCDCVVCICINIVREKVMERSLREYRESMKHIGTVSRNEVFQYDIAEKQAVIFIGGPVLNQINPSDQAIYGSFTKTLAARKILDSQYSAVLDNTFARALNGSTAICELRMKNNLGEQCWIMLRMEPQKNAAGDIYSLMGVMQDITAQKEATLQFLNESQFFHALLLEKAAYAQVDATEDKVLKTGGFWSSYQSMLNETPYSMAIQSILESALYPDDVRHCLELLQRANLIYACEIGANRLGCQFRRLMEDGKIIWMELGVHLFNDSISDHVMALLHISNIDQRKRQELRSAPESPYGVLEPAPVSEAQQQTKYSLLEQSFLDLLDKQWDMTYLIDTETYELIVGNTVFYRTIGMSKSECTGKKCYELMHGRSTPCPFCGRASWASDKFYVWKSVSERLGHEYIIKDKLVQWQGREVLLAIFIDISNHEELLSSPSGRETESHYTLNGIQRMTEAKDLPEAMHFAMEVIGFFFQAGTVRFWKETNDGSYDCISFWNRNDTAGTCFTRYEHEVSRWLCGRKWHRPLLIESRDTMLQHSFELYEGMKACSINSQRWVPIFDEGRMFGVIEVDNLSTNIQNTSFLESFSCFLISEWKSRILMEDILHASTHDDMTGLLSRMSYDRFLNDYNGESYDHIGVIIANINDLKGINRRLGYFMGDRFIKEFAGILKEQFPNAPVFRLNGDEFLVIEPTLSWDALSDETLRLEGLAENGGHYTVSCGCSWDDVEKDIHVLIEQAVLSMQVNKRRYYDSGVLATGKERHEMLQDMVKAIGANRFLVYLQPKIDLSKGTIIGAEALVRYQDEEHGVLPPDRFIPILESNNLIRYVDLFIFEEVCRLLTKWKERGIGGLVISLNFSRLTLLEHAIVPSVENIFKQYPIEKSSLEIEITESMSDMGKSVLYQSSRELHEAGYAISLDDFGTKYTNLSILPELDFNVLKVDRSLVASIIQKPSCRVILKHVIAMCKELDINVIAEGVESAEQEEILKGLGCRYGQGYLYGKPMPVKAFEQLFLEAEHAL